MAHVLIAEARFYDHLNDLLIAGARAAVDLVPAIRAREVTAIFATNDLNALGAMTVLRDAAIDVPTDCSVIGFDDFIAARHAFPPLTTIRQDATQMGTKAAHALLAQLSGEDAQRHTVLPVELVVRDSTAAPRS